MKVKEPRIKSFNKSKPKKNEHVSKFVNKEELLEVGQFVKLRKPAKETNGTAKKQKTEEPAQKKVSVQKSVPSARVINTRSKSVPQVGVGVKDETILKALNVLKQLAQISDKKRNVLFDEGKPILIQIECIRIPDCVSRKLRFYLPHWLVMDTSDVCLFVSDLKKGRKVDHEPTVQHYEDILKEKGITNIKAVIPIRQVRVEYDQMEMKRRLLTQYDFFLADAKVSGLLAHKLGMTFYRKNMLPVPVKMDSKDLKKSIEKALHKTVMKLHGTGQTYALNVANGQHTDEEACENIQAVLLELKKQFPGGWENIRSIHVKHPLSMAIPIYMTLKNRNTVADVVVKPLRPDNEVVEGELSTILGAKVKVFPKGQVQMKIDKSELDEDSDDPSAATKISKPKIENGNKTKKNKGGEIVKNPPVKRKAEIDDKNKKKAPKLQKKTELPKDESLEITGNESEEEDSDSCDLDEDDFDNSDDLDEDDTDDQDSDNSDETDEDNSDD